MKAREERVLAKHSRYSHTNVREVHEMHTTTMADYMRIGIYTVHELRDNTVTMGLRFCLHEVVAKNRDPIRNLFLTSTYTLLLHSPTFSNSIFLFFLQ